MDIKEYIQSGMIEQYVLGLATAEEAAELMQLREQHPAVNDAILYFENDLEQFIVQDKTLIPAHIKSSIQNKLFDNNDEQVITNNTGFNHTEQAPVRRLGIWKFLAAASIILLLVSTALNLYFYSGYKNSKSQYEALLTERNTLQANNASYKSALDSVQQNMQSLHLNNKNYKQEIADLQESFSIMHNPDVKEIRLKGILNKDNLATVYWNQQTKQVYFFKNYLKQTPPGKQYQLWAIVNGKPVSAGLIDVCSGLCKMKVIPNAQAFAVTLEKEGGSDVPTLTQMYVLGKV